MYKNQNNNQNTNFHGLNDPAYVIECESFTVISIDISVYISIFWQLCLWNYRQANDI